MNKLKQLQKRLGIESAIALVVLAGVVGLMMLTGNLAESAAQKKNTAEAGLSQDNSQLSAARSQLSRSGEAEKRFLDIQLARGNDNYASKSPDLYAWMTATMGRYRFPAASAKMALPAETAANKPELAGLEYNITQRTGATLDFEAMSDLHVYSFLNDLSRNAPGIVRVTSMSVVRSNDMTPQMIAQMVGGLAPNLVKASVTFDWIGINPKDVPADGTSPQPAPGAPGGM